MKHIYLMLIAAFFSFSTMSAQAVNLAIPGTLAETIAGMGYFTSLTVTGTLDSSDFMTLGDILNLETLDISGVTVVNNRVPTNAFFNALNLQSVKLPPAVTSIGAYAFCGCSKLAQLELPASLKVIDIYAFTQCSKLTPLDLPASLEKIGSASFANCILLTQIYIPSNVSFIGPSAFSYTNVTAFTVDPASQYFIAENGVLFNKDKTILYFYPGQKTALDYTIPSTVETLAYGSFNGISRLRTITIPASVQELYELPFTSCSDLTNIQVAAENLNYASLNGVLFNKEKTILIKAPMQKGGIFEVPASVSYIAEYAFHGNRNMEEIILPQNLDSIGAYAFDGCSNLGSLNLPEDLKEIQVGAFSSCQQFERMLVPLNVDSLPHDVFKGNGYLKTLILPSKLKYFEYTNLNSCGNIDSIWINAIIPPVVPAPYDFTRIETIYSTLYVPQGSLAAYSSHDFWKHFPIEEIEYSLELSDNSFNSEIAGLESEFSINSNTEWTISANQNWIHISKQKGWFDGKIEITVDANSGITREGVITVSGLGVESKTIEIQQAGLASAINEPDAESVKISLDPQGSYLWVENASGLKLSVYSISGECLVMTDLKSDYEVLDMQNMPSGIYLVKAGMHSVKVSK